MDDKNADKGAGAPRKFYQNVSRGLKDRWKRLTKKKTETGNGEKNGAGGRKSPFVAALIALLVVGYVPFSRFLFKPAEIGVVSLEKGKADVIYGILMKKEYLKIFCGYQGADAGSISFIMDVLGRPKELWADVLIPGGDTLSMPLYVSRLEEEEWRVVESRGLAIYEKDGRFSDLEQLARYVEGSREKIGLVGCSKGDVLLSLEGRAGSRKTELLTAPLRGPHSLDLLVTNNRLVVEISKRDLNLNIGEESVPVKLLCGDREVFSCELEDDGNVTGDGRMSAKPAVETLEVDGLENGVYRLQVAIEGDEFQDYVLESVKTDARSAGFLKMVHVYDPPPAGGSESRALEAYLESAPATLKAWTGIDGIIEKSVSVNGAETMTMTPWSPEGFAAVGERGVDELLINNPGDIVLQVDGGYFSFLPRTLFDPVYPLLGTVKGGKQWDCSYFLAGEYAHPVIDDGTGSFRVDFRFQDVEIPEGKFELVLMHISDEPPVLYSLLIRLE